MIDLEEGFANVRARVWTCPVAGHNGRRNSAGGPVVEVEWVDGVAHCLFPGCGRTSTDPVPRPWCDCEEYDCGGACCGDGQCTCSNEVKS